jgi:plastocyanin
MSRLFQLLLATLLVLAITGPATTVAQESTPDASPAIGECRAPDLPPGTPTPMEDASPPADSALATPEAEPAGEAAFPEPTPLPEGMAADPDTEARIMEGLMNWGACFSSGNFEAVAALSTPNFMEFATGSRNPYDFIAFLPEIAEESANQEDLFVGDVMTYPDGRFSIDNVYRSGNVIEHERFYIVEEDNYLKVDGLAFGLPVEPELLGGEPTVIEVALVDYAFAPTMNTIPSGTPIVFRATNQGTEPHVLAVVRYPEGTTAQQVIQGEIDGMEGITEFLGGNFSFPRQSFEVTLVDLEPGVYFLLCDVTTADGTPHYHLGMVAQITVE